jgi:hypothetical protein
MSLNTLYIKGEILKCQITNCLPQTPLNIMGEFSSPTVQIYETNLQTKRVAVKYI